jgi:hypothetical protein
MKGGDNLKISISKDKIIIEPVADEKLLVRQDNNGNVIISKE